jgi:hypothetical protein
MGDSVDGAWAYIAGQSFFSVTDATGAFQLSYVPAAAYTFLVHVSGKSAVSQTVTVSSGGATNLGSIEGCAAVFTGDFVERTGAKPGPICDNWTAFKNSISSTGTYSAITISGSNDPTGVTCSGASADTLCKAIKNSGSTSLSCDGRQWRTGICGDDVELNAGSASICVCDNADDYTVRPCIVDGGWNWGGIKTASCFAPSQTMTVRCQ